MSALSSVCSQQQPALGMHDDAVTVRILLCKRVGLQTAPPRAHHLAKHVRCAKVQSIGSRLHAVGQRQQMSTPDAQSSTVGFTGRWQSAMRSCESYRVWRRWGAPPSSAPTRRAR